MTRAMRLPVRTAVVGLGYFGRFHAKHYAAHPAAALAALCDTHPDRVAAVAAEHGGEAFTDHRELIGRVDAASVAVPTSKHFEVARDLMEAGIHVLVEKPIAEDVEEATALVDIAARNGVVLQVGHIERFSSAFRALAERVDRPIFIESRRISPWKPRATDVDVVLDLMIHDIDIVLGLVSSPVESIQALGAPVVSRSEDIANARLTFENGAVADITASRIAGRTERRMRVFQANSYLMCDFHEHRLTRLHRNGAPSAEGMDGLDSESWDIPREDGLANQIGEFLDCVSSGRAPTVDGRVGRDALAVAARITEGIRTHRERVAASFAV